jgi:hypothetical protein
MPVEHRATDADAGDAYSPRRRSFRRGHFLGNAFEAWAALAAFLTGLVFLLEPQALSNSAVASSAGALAALWGLLYAGGGLLVLIGLWVPSARVELAGLALFSSSAMVDAIALALTRGPAGIRVLLLYVGFVAASAMRGFLVLRMARVPPGDSG